MSNPLCNLYVDAGCPLGELDIDNVNKWACDHIRFLEDKICQLRHQYDEAIIQCVLDIKYEREACANICETEYIKLGKRAYPPPKILMELADKIRTR